MLLVVTKCIAQFTMPAVSCSQLFHAPSCFMLIAPQRGSADCSMVCRQEWILPWA